MGFETMVRLGDEAMEAREYRKAERYYSDALEQDQSSADAWFKKGRALHVLEDYSGARKCFSNVIALDPTNVDAYSYRAIGSEFTGDFEAAICELMECLEKEPDKVTYLAHLGINYHLLAMQPTTRPDDRIYYTARAYSYYDKIGELAPEHPLYQTRKCFSLMRAGKYEEALSCIREVVNSEYGHLYKDWSALAEGTLFMIYEDYEGAIEWYEYALSLNPHLADARAGLYKCGQLQGQTEREETRRTAAPPASGRGTRREICPTCHGEGAVTCRFCHGSLYQSMDDHMAGRLCPNCHGLGKTQCPSCRGRGGRSVLRGNV